MKDLGTEMSYNTAGMLSNQLANGMPKSHMGYPGMKDFGIETLYNAAGNLRDQLNNGTPKSHMGYPAVRRL